MIAWRMHRRPHLRHGACIAVAECGVGSGRGMEMERVAGYVVLLPCMVSTLEGLRGYEPRERVVAVARVNEKAHLLNVVFFSRLMSHSS